MYNSLTYRRNGVVLWQEHNVSKEYVVGCLIGLRLVLRDNILQGQTSLFSEHVVQLDNKVVNIADLDNLNKILTRRRQVKSQVTVDKVTQDYFWYLRALGYSSSYLDLYRFKSTAFISGFITGVKLLNKDFREFSSGTPFTLESGQIVWHPISGYDIEPLTNILLANSRIQAPEIPYYTMKFEDDLNSEDFD